MKDHRSIEDPSFRENDSPRSSSQSTKRKPSCAETPNEALVFSLEAENIIQNICKFI